MPRRDREPNQASAICIFYVRVRPHISQREGKEKMLVGLVFKMNASYWLCLKKQKRAVSQVLPNPLKKVRSWAKTRPRLESVEAQTSQRRPSSKKHVRYFAQFGPKRSQSQQLRTNHIFVVNIRQHQKSCFTFTVQNRLKDQ